MGATFRQNARFEAAPLSDEAILFDPVTSNFFMLNHTGALIWDRLVTPRNVEVLAAEICDSFANVTLAQALQDVQAALDQMVKLELVVPAD